MRTPEGPERFAEDVPETNRDFALCWDRREGCKVFRASHVRRTRQPVWVCTQTHLRSSPASSEHQLCWGKLPNLLVAQFSHL